LALFFLDFQAGNYIIECAFDWGKKQKRRKENKRRRA
jgi:hypothetical protein